MNIGQPAAALDYPPEPPQNSVPTATPVPIRYVTDKDWPALIYNILSIVLLYAVLSILIGQFRDSSYLTIGVPLTIVCSLAIWFHQRLWKDVDGLQASVWLDYISPAKLIVLIQGFHFVTWTSKNQHNDLDFQRKELIEAKEDKKTGIRFESMDGYEMTADVTIFWRRRDGEDAVSHSLRYQNAAELTTKILAATQSRLSDLAGRNSYATMLRHKDQVAIYAAYIFGGNDKVSDFEKDTGTEVYSPYLTNLGLSPESKKTFAVGAEIGAIRDAIQALQGTGLTAQEANLAAQAIQGKIDRRVMTYQGIPDGARVVALGDAAVAVAAKGGK